MQVRIDINDRTELVEVDDRHILQGDDSETFAIAQVIWTTITTTISGGREPTTRDWIARVIAWSQEPNQDFYLMMRPSIDAARKLRAQKVVVDPVVNLKEVADQWVKLDADDTGAANRRHRLDSMPVGETA